MLDRLAQALRCFPKQIKTETDKLSFAQQKTIEEFRLRNGYPPTVLMQGAEYVLDHPAIHRDILEEIILQATGQAVYSAKEMLRNGFLTLSGGHRLGICGTAVYKGKEISFLKEISSINLRIASERKGFASAAANHLWPHPHSTLIIGPPGCGKTTLLRDLIYQLSQRYRWRVSVCDERMELAACVDGIPQFSLGQCTDVISGASKAQGIEMLLRTMNPQWIAVDEITSEEDVKAMLRASYCGVRFLATAHAFNPEELYARQVYRALLDTKVFRNLILINRGRELQIKELE